MAYPFGARDGLRELDEDQEELRRKDQRAHNLCPERMVQQPQPQGPAVSFVRDRQVVLRVEEIHLSAARTVQHVKQRICRFQTQKKR
jgi:hypothetical protein